MEVKLYKNTNTFTTTKVWAKTYTVVTRGLESSGFVMLILKLENKRETKLCVQSNHFTTQWQNQNKSEKVR